MKRIICFIALTSLAYSAVGQSLDSLRLALEWKYFNAADAQERNFCMIEKFNALVKDNAAPSDVLDVLKRVELEATNWDSAQISNFYWNKALVSYLNNSAHGAYYSVRNYLEYADESPSMQSIILEYLILNIYDGELSHAFYDEKVKDYPELIDISCLQNVYGVPVRKGVGYSIASAIVPGSGLIMQGSVLKGLITLSVNAAIIYGLYSLWIAALPINAVLWAVTWFPKFYLGNIKASQSLFQQKLIEKKSALNMECQRALSDFLNRYPLSYIILD